MQCQLKNATPPKKSTLKWCSRLHLSSFSLAGNLLVLIIPPAILRAKQPCCRGLCPGLHPPQISHYDNMSQSTSKTLPFIQCYHENKSSGMILESLRLTNSLSFWWNAGKCTLYNISKSLTDRFYCSESWQKVPCFTINKIIILIIILILCFISNRSTNLGHGETR